MNTENKELHQWEYRQYEIVDGAFNDITYIQLVELPPTPTDAEVLALFDAGVEIDYNGSDEDLIYLNDKSTGNPLGEIRKCID